MLRIEIYKSTDLPGWILEVTNEEGVVIVWNEEFETDHGAVDAFVKAVEDKTYPLYS